MTANRVFGAPLPPPFHSRFVSFLVLRNQPRFRIPPSDLVGGLLREPHGAIRRGNGRMDARSALVRSNELFDLSGIWIQLADSIPGSKIGDPDLSVFIRRGAERH